MNEYDINYLNNLRDPFVFNNRPDLSGTGNNVGGVAGKTPVALKL